MRIATILLVLTAFITVVLADTSVEDDFTGKFEKLNKAVAESHYKLAKRCFHTGLNKHGYSEAALAFVCVPDQAKTRKLLGYKLKNGKWLIQLKKRPAKKDAENVPDNARADYAKRRDKQRLEAGREFIKLANWATKNELPVHARVLFKRALSYDPLNVTALAGAGWVKDTDGIWLRPAVVAERKQVADFTTSLPEAKVLEDLPQWVGQMSQSINAITLGNVQIIRTSEGVVNAPKNVWLTAKLAESYLGKSDHRQRLVLVFRKAEHKKYVDLRFPGTPGFADDDYIVGNHEVEVYCSSEEKAIDLERAVYAFALREVQARLGEHSAHWLEVGFASNITRQLLGSVETAEHEGEAEGPKKTGRWKRTIKQLLAEADSIGLDEIIAADALTETELIYTHFFTRWLMQVHRAGLESLVSNLRTDDDAETALENTFEEPWVTLEQQFIDWVRKEL